MHKIYYVGNWNATSINIKWEPELWYAEINIWISFIESQVGYYGQSGCISIPMEFILHIQWEILKIFFKKYTIKKNGECMTNDHDHIYRRRFQWKPILYSQCRIIFHFLPRIDYSFIDNNLRHLPPSRHSSTP